jgi:hypothetical protein
VAWETKDITQACIAGLAVVAATVSIFISLHANNSADRLDNAQLTQLRAILDTTPIGRITTLRNGEVLSHLSGPLTVKARIQNNPGDGDWWLIVHKPLDPKNGNDADTYYPTPMTQPGDKFVGVYIGVPRDTATKTYYVGLYFCNSGASLSLRNTIANIPNRNNGLATLTDGCQLVNDVKVARLGP